VTLLSMTGFGEARSDSGDYQIAVELRTVNSRYFKLHLRSTEGYGGLDARVESVVRKVVSRGAVHCNLRIRHVTRRDDYRLNLQVLEQYVDQLQELAARRNLSEDIRLESLGMMPGVVEEQSGPGQDAEQMWALVEPILRSALDQLSAMRGAEGEALAVDLAEQCQTVTTCLDQVETTAPQVAEHYRRRLEERVHEALHSLKVPIEPVDLVREVALYADRCDISEEIVRLRSHLQQFQKAMGLTESAGRKLEFICQEMGRETNTIGSKANHAEISQQVVQIKTALERIREQIQNVQ